MPGMVDATYSTDAYTTFLNAITERPEAFLHPTDALHASALVVSKRLLDPLAKSSSVFDQVYTEGMHIDQIWQQIKTISEAVVEDVLDMELPEELLVADSNHQPEEEASEEEPFVDSDEEDDQIEVASEAEAEEDDDDDIVSDASALDLEDEEHNQSFDDLEDMLIDQEGEDVSGESEVGAQDLESAVVKDVFGLNDRFFNIDDFNKQTEIMDANYQQEQSEDDIDYNADPDEASDAEDLEQELEDEDNANEIRYGDFFAPPKRASRSAMPAKHKRARFDNDEDIADQEAPSDNDGDVADENEDHTIARMQKDLFADDGDDDDQGETGPKLSAHAKRQLRLAEEIRQLENENVSKKDWTLMGEASARARPKDSLLEEGMDFERTSRPVPIVTEEFTQTLEDMIKARVVEGRFDTVTRRIPESVHKFTKNSFELDENKPSQSLAEVYENEFQKKQNPEGYKTAKDVKLDAEHQEIAEMFKDICYNLDSLSSWHYTPKPVTESLNIVTNAPAIEMEDAQPLTMSSAARLAPQEQYTTKAEKGEVAGKSGLPTSKAEMTSEERQRYRRKQRAVAKKSGAQKKTQFANMSKSKQEQAGVIDTLKKANVKVIRNGKTKDLKSGRDYTGMGTAVKPSNLKL